MLSTMYSLTKYQLSFKYLKTHPVGITHNGECSSVAQMHKDFNLLGVLERRKCIFHILAIIICTQKEACHFFPVELKTEGSYMCHKDKNEMTLVVINIENC